MEVKHIIHVLEVTGIEPAMKQGEKKGEWIPKVHKDGSPVYTLIGSFKGKIQVGAKEKEVPVPDKLDSIIEVKVGTKNITFECEQYVMPPNRTGAAPGVFYRAIKIVDNQK